MGLPAQRERTTTGDHRNVKSRIRILALSLTPVASTSVVGAWAEASTSLSLKPSAPTSAASAAAKAEVYFEKSLVQANSMVADGRRWDWALRVKLNMWYSLRAV